MLLPTVGNARKFQPIPGFQAVRLIRGGEELVQSWEVSLRRPQARCGGDGQGEDPSAANDATVLGRPRARQRARANIDPLENVAPLESFLGPPREPVLHIAETATPTHALVTQRHPDHFDPDTLARVL